MRYKIETAGIDVSAWQAFVFGGVSYPANWTSLASPDDLAAIGMIAYEPEVSIDLDGQKAAKVAALTAACAAEIVGGFASSALGAPYTYPSNQTDQINLMGSATASLLPDLATGWTTPFWCADGSGAWAYRDHTAAQIQQAGADGKAHVVAAQTKLAGLVTAANGAASAEAVAAIVW